MHHCTRPSRAQEPRSAHPSSALFSEGSKAHLAQSKRTDSPNHTTKAAAASAGHAGRLCTLSLGSTRRAIRVFTLHQARKRREREHQEKPMRRARGGRLEAALARG